MDNQIKKYLQDILTAIEEVDSFFYDKPSTLMTSMETSSYEELLNVISKS